MQLVCSQQGEACRSPWPKHSWLAAHMKSMPHMCCCAMARGCWGTGRQECNAREPLLQNPTTFDPAVQLGCSIHEAFQDLPSDALADHLRLYEREQYILVWQQGRGRLVLRKGCQPRDEMRALWQVGCSPGSSEARQANFAVLWPSVGSYFGWQCITSS